MYKMRSKLNNCDIKPTHRTNGDDGDDGKDAYRDNKISFTLVTDMGSMAVEFAKALISTPSTKK